jgi:hypothetical protein
MKAQVAQATTWFKVGDVLTLVGIDPLPMWNSDTVMNKDCQWHEVKEFTALGSPAAPKPKAKVKPKPKAAVSSTYTTEGTTEST